MSRNFAHRFPGEQNSPFTAASLSLSSALGCCPHAPHLRAGPFSYTSVPDGLLMAIPRRSWGEHVSTYPRPSWPQDRDPGHPWLHRGAKGRHRALAPASSPSAFTFAFHGAVIQLLIFTNGNSPGFSGREGECAFWPSLWPQISNSALTTVTPVSTRVPFLLSVSPSRLQEQDRDKAFEGQCAALPSVSLKPTLRGGPAGAWWLRHWGPHGRLCD